jgi:hypothetical protein
MKRLVLVFALLAAIVSCAGESNFPTPTGKGTIRMINAIGGSPDIEFSIEAFGLGSVGFQNGSSGVRYDDFSYAFNFDIFEIGQLAVTRINSTTLAVGAEKDHTLLLTGDLLNPTVTAWVADERSWGDTETVFQMRFSHAIEGIGAIDVFFAAAGVVPVAGEEVGTLNFTEILPPADFEEGEYVLTLTSAGNPADILFQSIPLSYVSRNASIMATFAGDESDTATVVARAIDAFGTGLPVTDATAEPTVRFIQASQDLPNADVYDDEMLMNQLLSNHAFGDVSGDLPIAVGTTNYSYTTVGDTSAVLFEGGIATVAGLHYNFLVIGEEGERFGQSYVADRRSISTLAKFGLRHAAVNHPEVDIYIVGADETIDEEDPRIIGLDYSLPAPSLGLAAGSFDIYATTSGEKTIVAGPLRLDTTFGDVFEVILFDVVDPAMAEFRVLPPL